QVKRYRHFPETDRGSVSSYAPPTSGRHLPPQPIKYCRPPKVGLSILVEAFPMALRAARAIRGGFMKILKSRTVQALLAGTVMVLSPLELAAQETERYAFDIPAQDLGDALRTVAAAAAWQLSAAADEIKGVSV